MRDIFRIFGNDVKSVGRHFFAMAIIIAISVLPALYAWVNIYANGNPYVNTGNIDIAVASRDPGVDLEDGTHVNMADEVFGELKESTSIGWQFPDTPEEAIAGVESGKYYAAIIFEDNFTYNMYHFEQALLDDKEPLTYYENAKKNAIASKITETAASTLQENINTKYLQTVFSLIYDETSELSDELSEDGENTADSVIKQLTQFRNTLDSYDAAISSFTGNSGRVQSGLARSKKDLANSRAQNKKSLTQARKDIAEAQKAAVALKNIIDDKMTDLNKNLDQLEKLLKDIQGVDPVTEEDLKTTEEQAADLVNRIREQLQSLDNSGNTDAIDNAIDAMNGSLDDINKILLDGAADLPDRVQELLAAIDTIRTLQNTVLGPGFDTMMDNLSKTLAMLDPFLTDVSDMLDDVNPVLDATSKTVTNMDKSLLQVQKMLRSASDRIGGIIAQVNAAEEDERVQLLIDLLGGDSDLYGKFFSSLVDVETTEIYQVASYGAAMAPFYSVLAIWVGGVILVSILKTGVDRNKFPGLSEAQYFFGRFILFFLLGQVQAAVIVAGDIYLLGCQPVHPGFMFLAASVTSLVFVMLIYALTLSFGDVGKAIVVVIMVVQIAGSSGSYPIEILPVIFSKIYRFFPFPYAINAMREALCGMYGYDYGIYLAELFIFAVVGLLIGLLVRRPFIGMNNFVSEKIEETEVL